MSDISSKDRELVLCVSRPCVERLWSQRDAFGPWLPIDDENAISEWLAKATVAFLPRSIAEHDPSWLHFATYAVLTDGERVFSYRRGTSGGEDRLHGKTSIGVGGHVGIEDWVPNAAHMLIDATFRELDEELEPPVSFATSVAGLIADSTTAVNRVHIGFVTRLDVNREHVRVREDCLAEPRWLTVAELAARESEMEVWSRIVLDNLFAGAIS